MGTKEKESRRLVTYTLAKDWVSACDLGQTGLWEGLETTRLTLSN